MKTLARFLLLASLLGCLSDRGRAELIVALTPSDTFTPGAASLVTFTSEDPSQILSAVAISGLQAGEQVHGIDVRPATGELYALTSEARLYVLNASTGVATLRATLAAAVGDSFTALSGAKFGVDFNPAADRLRVVSDTQQSLRINPDTGAVNTDSPLAYLSGDISYTLDPQIVDAAYTNNDTDPATSTALFLLEQNLYSSTTIVDGTSLSALSLVRQGGENAQPSPNSGELTTIGPFARNGVTAAGFDVSPSGTAFAGVRLVAEVGGEPFFALLKVILSPDPLDPDALTKSRNEPLGYIGDAHLPIEDIAVLQSIQFALPVIAASEPPNGTSVLPVTVSRQGGTAGTATVHYSTRSGTAIAGSDFLSAQGTLTFNPGESSKTINVTLLTDGTPGFPEDEERFQIVLSDPTTATLGGANVTTVRISANDFTDARGPTITYFGLTGPSRGITGAVVEFDEDIDEATAENVENYQLFGTDRKRKKRPFTLTSAVYDPNTRSVTLTAAPFVQTDLKRLTFIARGKVPANSPGLTGIRDVSNNLLDGNANGTGGDNAVLKFAVLSGKKFTTVDQDGDRGVVEVTGPGSIDANLLLGKKRRTQFWILDTVPLRSSLTGTVKPSPRGDGIVVISEIIGLDKKEFSPLLSNPAFRVNTLTFSSNAVGRSGR